MDLINRRQLNSVIEAESLALAADYAASVDKYHAEVQQLNDAHQRRLNAARERFERGQSCLINELTALMKQRA